MQTTEPGGSGSLLVCMYIHANTTYSVDAKRWILALKNEEDTKAQTQAEAQVAAELEKKPGRLEGSAYRSSCVSVKARTTSG